MEFPHFHPDESGYVRQWLITDVNAAPYAGEAGSDNELRRRVIDPELVPPGEGITLGGAGPLGKTWRFYDPGANIFVEQSGFWHALSVLDFYAATDLESSAAADVRVRFWSCGCGDLWVNGRHSARNPCVRYMYPAPLDLTVPLRKGTNRLQTRVRALGVRDTRFLFGFQITGSTRDFQIVLPGCESRTAGFVEATAWLDSLRVEAPTVLWASGPPPVVATVESEGAAMAWGDAAKCLIPAVDQLVVTVTVEGQKLSRRIEIPANRRTPVAEPGGPEKARAAVIRRIADKPGHGRDRVMSVLARHTMGRRGPDDTAIIEAACDWIDGRPDCADFPLAALLRLMHGNSLTHNEQERIRQSALGFRYWPDEPGVDALCFGSENHSLLFHGCQMLAGNLFPNAVFSNSGRTGREQAEIGRKRCVNWVDAKTEKGFVEFLSSTYIPLTVAALLNVVDFAADAALAEKASALVNRLFTVLAEHAFDGVTASPQGRVYRNVLTPETSGTQALLGFAVPTAVVAANDWVSFVAASEKYVPPADLVPIMNAEISKTYREAAVEIHIEKTRGYLLTSLEVPASFQDMEERVHAPQSNPGLIPGRQGYQQHLWHATLGRDCHVFVNHPGASFDFSSSRPGFWYGNGTLPRVHQEGGNLFAIFDIDPEHPIPFTHAHWPTDTFDDQRVEGHWAFGRRGHGVIALWCSGALAVHTEVLTDRELRAEGRRVAWMVICRNSAEFASLDAFAESCRTATPLFDAETLKLTSGIGSLEYAGPAI